MNKTDFYGFLNIKQINLVSNCSNPFIEHCARKIDSFLQYIYMYIYISVCFTLLVQSSITKLLKQYLLMKAL